MAPDRLGEPADRGLDRPSTMRRRARVTDVGTTLRTTATAWRIAGRGTWCLAGGRPDGRELAALPIPKPYRSAPRAASSGGGPAMEGRAR